MGSALIDLLTDLRLDLNLPPLDFEIRAPNHHSTEVRGLPGRRNVAASAAETIGELGFWLGTPSTVLCASVLAVYRGSVHL